MCKAYKDTWRIQETSKICYNFEILDAHFLYLSLFNRVSNLLELFVETFQPWRSERRITGLGRGAQNGPKARCKGTAAFILTSYSGTVQSTAD